MIMESFQQLAAIILIGFILYATYRWCEGR